MKEEKHILTKLEKIYFGKKENEKLTMHEIGVVLDYVALLEQNNRYKNEEIERLNNIINELEKYIKESCWKDDWGVESIYVETLLNKLQELKGSDKE